MGKEEMTKRAPMPHSIVMDDRKKADISGVARVITFDESEVSLETDLGALILTGDKLHVTRLMLEEGRLTLEGRIDGVEYEQRGKKRGLFHRP